MFSCGHEEPYLSLAGESGGKKEERIGCLSLPTLLKHWDSSTGIASSAAALAALQLRRPPSYTATSAIHAAPSVAEDIQLKGPKLPVQWRDEELWAGITGRDPLDEALEEEATPARSAMGGEVGGYLAKRRWTQQRRYSPSQPSRRSGVPALRREDSSARGGRAFIGSHFNYSFCLL